MSGDGLTWRLFLRPTVKFQDGSPLTAGDVKRTFDDVMADPASRSLRVCLPYVSSIAAASDREVVFTLTRRCSYLLDDLDRAISRTAADGATRIGTGAFAMSSSSADGIVLEANRHYYGGAPAIDRVVVKPFDALRTAWAEMLRGEVDFLWEVGPDTAEFLSDRATVEVRSYLSFYAYGLMLNSAQPQFRSADVRRALNMAVDRAAIVQQALKGHGVPADGPVWPRYWARDPQAPPTPFDSGRGGCRCSALRTRPHSNSPASCRRTSRSSSAWPCWRSSNWARSTSACGWNRWRRTRSTGASSRDSTTRRPSRSSAGRTHDLPPLLAFGRRDETLELLGLSQRRRRRGAGRGAGGVQRAGVQPGHPPVRDGAARRPARDLPRVEPDRPGRRAAASSCRRTRPGATRCTRSTAGSSASPGARRDEDAASPLRGHAGHGGRPAAADVRRGVGVLPARGHAPHGNGRQPERRAPGWRADPPLHLDQPPDPARARRRCRRRRPQPRPAGPDLQELRPALPGIPRVDGVRRGRAADGHEPHRRAGRASSRRGRRRAVRRAHVAGVRRQRPAAYRARGRAHRPRRIRAPAGSSASSASRNCGG